MSQYSDGFSRAVVSQRIVYVDSYTSFPIPEVDVVYSHFRAAEVKRVPVIRIYGATTHGQKACAHIHGVFPYIYIEHDASIFNLENRLAEELDREIGSSLKEYNTKQGEHVYKIIQVIGRSFYGYKSKPQTFLKIFFYSPFAVSKAAQLLQSGKIMGQSFQPFEAHIPYILQFFLDFKLHGMNFIHFSDVKFRGYVEPEGNVYSMELQDLEVGTKVDPAKLPRHAFLPAKVLRRSRCELEFDVNVADIVTFQAGIGKNPGIEAIWWDEKERRRQIGCSDSAEITIPHSQDRPSSASFVFSREKEHLETLQSKLMAPFEAICESNENDGVPSTPPVSCLPLLEMTPASQVLIEDLTLINADSPAMNQSLDWDEQDDEMISLLEDMARNRVLEEDNDSIISSQVREEFLDGPANECLENIESAGIGNISLTQDNWDDDEDWGQGFFSTSVFQLLDKVENDATGQTSNFINSVADKKSEIFQLHQADGQFDSSEDDDAVTFVPEKSRALFKTNQAKHFGIPVTSISGRLFGKMKSAENVLSKPLSFIRSASSPSLPHTTSPNRNRLRPPTPPSPVVFSSSSDDDDLSIKKQKLSTCNISFISSIDRLRKFPIYVSALPSNSKSINLKSRSPSIISSCSSENASEETNYVPSESDSDERKDSIQLQPDTLTADPEPSTHTIGTNTIENVEKPDSASAASGVDSGIRSFYQYATEDFSQETPEEYFELPGEFEPTPPSQDQSINSVYDYSEPEETSNSEEATTSFHDICMSQLESSSESGDSSGSQRGKSHFVRKARRSKLKLKQEREFFLTLKDSFCPSIFSYEVVPLKILPSAIDIEKALKQANCESENHSAQERPLSLSYVQPKMIHPEHSRNSESRHRLVSDILFFKKEIEFLQGRDSRTTTTSPLASGTDATRNRIRESEGNVTGFSDSDSDEPSRHTKPFRFGGGNRSSGEDDLSSEISDNESEIEPTPPPLLPSRTRRRALTLGWIARKRRRLNWGSQEETGSQSAVLSLEQSELDSISFSSSQSPPGIFNSSNYQDVKAVHEKQFLRTLSMEVHCSARGSLTPDPTQDAIHGIFYFLHGESNGSSRSSQRDQFGCLMVDVKFGTGDRSSTASIRTYADELSMIKGFIQMVHETDPDVFVGYEICRFSWGYLIDRGRELGLDMTLELSRLLPLPTPAAGKASEQRNQQQWNESISGRIVLNLWRLMRHEMTVTSYTFENAVFQILHERVHLLPYRKLADQWETLSQKFKVISYFKRRVVDVIRIIEKLDLINRTSELARLFGIQFFEVLSRGSQFRVESMMLRLAKAENLIPPSPSPQQRASMKAPEYLPLIMEPESKFYTDPVAVLDFQSLYPSMMIAYNYCFSTCVGRVKNIAENTSFPFGCLSQNIPSRELNVLLSQGLVHISPCGVAFVKESVKKGILGEMLEQILDTRQMVKRSMKKYKTDATLQKVLDSRQLGLKLIANVTYGYTSANFSGRMPSVEIADSVVSKGRETLQRAIDFVNDNESRFHGKVVYGDTDSLFIHFPGMTRSEAFRRSQQIVDEVTAGNPKPVKLKLEKVYQPCILQTKKRYVGYAYETPDQVKPTYDAKGIETVRRDGCPATGKILKGALELLFVTQDPMKVKRFVQEQFRKIFMGRVSLSKYTFAREYRGRGGYKPTAVVPSLEIAKRLAEKDPRAEPLQSQRVPYVVVYGDPDLPLIQLTRRPQEFIENSNLRLNAHYYIEKAIIPPLNRCFTLAKIDVSKWYDEMPRKYLKSHYAECAPGGSKKGTIDQYFTSENCVKCESRTQTGFCDSCFENIGEVGKFLEEEMQHLSSKFQTCCNICTDCSKEEAGICVNMDCPVKHRYLRYDRDNKTRLPKLQSLNQKIIIAMSSW